MKLQQFTTNEGISKATLVSPHYVHCRSIGETAIISYQTHTKLHICNSRFEGLLSCGFSKLNQCSDLKRMIPGIGCEIPKLRGKITIRHLPQSSDN